MKTIVAAAALSLTAFTAVAEELAPGLSLNTEIKAWHKLDAESNHITVNPELEWTPNHVGPLALSIGTTITVYDDTSAGDHFILFDALDDGSHPNIELGATYDINAAGQLFMETEWNANTNQREELEVGVSFKF